MEFVSTAWAMVKVLAILLGIAAVIISVLKPGKSAQAVRAVGVVAIFSAGFWVGLAAAVWAVLDYVLPNKDKILKTETKAKK